MKGLYFQKELFEVAGISKQAFYQHQHQLGRKKHTEQQILQIIRDARSQWEYRKMGSRPLYYALGIDQVGINRFEKLISVNGLGVGVKHKWIRTTESYYDQDDKNFIKGLQIRDINRVILGDITYFFVADQLYYIFTLKDAYSKMIVGLYGSQTMKATSARACLLQAIKLRGAKNLVDCIHHTDGGKQYKSKLYRSTASYLKWSIAANCLENGMAEQLNFILKNHYLAEQKIKNVKQLNYILRKVKQFLNEEVPVKNLKYRTPVAFEHYIQSIPLEKRTPFIFSSFEKVEKGTLTEA